MTQFINAIRATNDPGESYGRVMRINPLSIQSLETVSGPAAAKELRVDWDEVDDVYGSEITVLCTPRDRFLIRHDLKHVRHAIAYLRRNPDVDEVMVDDCPPVPAAATLDALTIAKAAAFDEIALLVHPDDEGLDHQWESNDIVEDLDRIVRRVCPHVGMAECQDCGNIEPVVDLKPAKDLDQRVSGGERVPDGECTKCGALSHRLSVLAVQP